MPVALYDGKHLGASGGASLGSQAKQLALASAAWWRHKPTGSKGLGLAVTLMATANDCDCTGAEAHLRCFFFLSFTANWRDFCHEFRAEIAQFFQPAPQKTSRAKAKIRANFGNIFPSCFSGCLSLVCIAAFLFQELLATQPREHRLNDLDFSEQKSTPDPLRACGALTHEIRVNPQALLRRDSFCAKRGTTKH